MAYNKEALAIVLDVGPDMQELVDGEVTALQQSLEAINMILQRKLFSESKDEVALVLFGTNETANDLAQGSKGYQRVSLARTLGLVDWDLIQFVQNDIKTGDQPADFLDALVVTLNHVITALEGKKGFSHKRIVLFSNLAGAFDDDQLDDIIGGMKEKEVELNVIGPDLDDTDSQGGGDVNGSDEGGRGAKPRSTQQQQGEQIVKRMLDILEGGSYSFKEAVPMLSYFQSRQVRSTAWKQELEIGSSLKIPICLYVRVKEAKPKSFKNIYAKDADADTERLRTFHLNNDEETEIDKEETVEGHRYGSTLVPFSADDKEAMKYTTEKCFQVLGFTKTENVRRHQIMGDTTQVCVAQKEDEAAVVALSALINALYETNMVAIVRRVYNKNGAVKIGCLWPCIKSKYELPHSLIGEHNKKLKFTKTVALWGKNFRATSFTSKFLAIRWLVEVMKNENLSKKILSCLYYFELAFSEDLRQYTFGSLPVNEAVTTANKKFAPSDEQLEAMEELVNCMDLSQADCDEDGEPREAIKPKLTFNPYLQRLYQCLEQRALQPDEALPELKPRVAASLKVPPGVLTRAQRAFDKIKQLYRLELSAAALKGKDAASGESIFKDDEDEPDTKRIKLDTAETGAASGAGLQEMLKAAVTEVGSTTPVEDFRSLIARKDKDYFSEAHKMMRDRVEQLIMESFGTQFYSKAIDCLTALREESVKNSEAGLFNKFLEDLKAKLRQNDRTNFWSLVQSGKIGLISSSECSDSTVSPQDAEVFLSDSGSTEEKPAEATDNADADDLLNEME